MDKINDAIIAELEAKIKLQATRIEALEGVIAVMKTK